MYSLISRNLRKRCRLAIYLLLGAVGFLLLAAGAFYLFLQTELGQVFLENRLNRMLAWEDTRIEVSGISGRLPFELKAESVKIHDRNGVWAELEEFRLQWLFGGLLFYRRLDVPEIGAENIFMHRIPDSQAEQRLDEPFEAEKWAEWSWPFPPVSIKRIEVGSFSPPSNLIGEAEVYSFSGSFYADRDNLMVPIARLQSRESTDTGVLEIEMRGQWRAGKLSLMAEARDTSLWSDYLRLESDSGEMHALLSGRGTFDDWRGQFSLKTDKWGSGEFIISTTGDSGMEYLNMAGETTISESLPPLLQRQYPAAILAGFELGKGANLAFAGRLALNTLRFDSHFNFRLPEFSKRTTEKAGEESDKEFSLALELDGDVTGDLRLRQYFLVLRGGAEDLFHRQEFMRDFLGSESHFSGRVEIKPNGLLQLDDFSLDWTGGRVSAAGKVNLTERHFSGNGNLWVPDLSRFRDLREFSIGGSLGLHWQGDGEFTSPSFKGRLQGRDFSVGNDVEADLDGTFLAEYRDDKWRGGMVLKAEHQRERLSLAGDFRLPQGRMELRNIRGEGYGLCLTGDLDIDLATGIVDGGVKMISSDLRPLGKLFDQETAGQVEADLKFHPQNNLQNLSFSFKAENGQWKDVSLAEAMIEGAAEDIYNARQFTLQLDLNDLQARHVDVDNWNLSAEGSLEQTDFFTSVCAAQGDYQLRTNLAGTFSQDHDKQRLAIFLGEGEIFDVPFSLRTPLIVKRGEKAWELAPVNLDFGGGVLSLFGVWSPKQVEGEVSIRDFSLQNYVPEDRLTPARTADFALRLEGDGARPELNGSLRLHELFPHLFEGDEELSFYKNTRAGIQFAMDGDVFSVQAAVFQEETELLSGNVAVPISFSLVPFSFSTPSPLPLQAAADGELDIAKWLEPWLTPMHRLEGTGRFAMRADGDFQNPELSGHFEWLEGGYENLELGLYLTDLQLLVDGTPDGMEISRLHAVDGRGGELSGDGWLKLRPLSELAWRLRISPRDFRLLHQRQTTAEVDEGEVVFHGHRHQSVVEGDLSFNSLTFELERPPPPELRELPVVEINRPSHLPEEIDHEAALERDIDFPAVLDLRLNFPARFYLRGFGLDTEWRGVLDIQGTADAPAVQGRLETVRGHLMILNRRLNLDRESTIVFHGGVPIEPVFNLLAYHRRRDREAGLRIFGTPEQPDFEITSDPPMPQEEALAWLLFGRSLSDLTPLQALQLVNAARNLLRGEPGLDVLGRIRTIAGVDDIEILPQDEEGMPLVGIGRYVHERVFLQLRAGLGIQQSAVVTEVELTPRISLESTVGADRQTGIGLFWKYDY